MPVGFPDPCPFDGAGVTIAVGGLTGRTPGAEIHKGRANANVLMGRILRAAARRTELRLLRVDGGLKDNAIPVACNGPGRGGGAPGGDGRRPGDGGRAAQ